MKAYDGVDVYIYVFLTSALVGGEWSASRPNRFTPGEKAPDTLWIAGWMDPRTSLGDMEKRKFLILPGHELRPIGCPTRSQSLYRLPCSYLPLSVWDRYDFVTWGTLLVLCRIHSSFLISFASLQFNFFHIWFILYLEALSSVACVHWELVKFEIWML
jgi:hypothetical protein